MFFPCVEIPCVETLRALTGFSEPAGRDHVSRKARTPEREPPLRTLSHSRFRRFAFAMIAFRDVWHSRARAQARRVYPFPASRFSSGAKVRHFSYTQGSYCSFEPSTPALRTRHETICDGRTSGGCRCCLVRGGAGPWLGHWRCRG